MEKINIVIFGYLCIFLGHLHAAPTSFSKWKTPCGSPDSTMTVSPITIGLNTTLGALEENTADLVRLAKVVKSKYVPPAGKRITGSKQLIQYLQSYDVPGLNLTKMEYYDTNLTREFLDDYEKFSRLAVFLEQILINETVDEFGEYTEWIKPVENEVYTILCNLQIALQTFGNLTVSNFIERNIMEDSWRFLENRAYRFMRDYIVFHKAEKFGELVYEKYHNVSLSLTEYE